MPEAHDASVLRHSQGVTPADCYLLGTPATWAQTSHGKELQQTNTKKAPPWQSPTRTATRRPTSRGT
eukprot:5402298-Amphidinium_carterae.1